MVQIVPTMVKLWCAGFTAAPAAEEPNGLLAWWFLSRDREKKLNALDLPLLGREESGRQAVPPKNVMALERTCAAPAASMLLLWRFECTTSFRRAFSWPRPSATVVQCIQCLMRSELALCLQEVWTLSTAWCVAPTGTWRGPTCLLRWGQ